jgi:hypothetical protein
MDIFLHVLSTYSTLAAASLVLLLSKELKTLLIVSSRFSSLKLSTDISGVVKKHHTWKASATSFRKECLPNCLLK